MVEAQVRADARPIWQRHLGKILIVSLLFNLFAWWSTDEVTKGRLILFGVAAVALYVGGEVVKALLSPDKLLSVGEHHVVRSAQKFFLIPISMADCVEMRPLSTREWLYQFVVPGNGEVWTLGWDRVRREISRSEPFPISYLQRKFSEDKLMSALLTGQIVRDRAQELAEKSGLYVPGVEEDE